MIRWDDACKADVQSRRREGGGKKPIGRSVVRGRPGEGDTCSESAALMPPEVFDCSCQRRIGAEFQSGWSREVTVRDGLVGWDYGCATE